MKPWELQHVIVRVRERERERGGKTEVEEREDEDGRSNMSSAIARHQREAS